MLKTIFKPKKVFSTLLLGLVFTPSFAQYEIKKYTINSGGETSTGGTYQVSGSVGQADASNQLTGGNYAMNGGFWHETTNTPAGDLIFKNGFEQIQEQIK